LAKDQPTAFALRHLKWNIALFYAEVSVFFAGFACFDSTTVLPVLLARLGASDLLIGFVRAIQMFGFTLPALAGSHYVHGRPHHKRFLVITCALSRIGLPTLVPAFLLYGESRPNLVLSWFCVVYLLFWLFDGTAAVSWYDIMAKSIPPRLRGAFLGGMQMLLGLVAMGAGYAVTRILGPGGPPFPQNFALLAALWSAGAWISQIGILFLREPPGMVDPAEEKSSLIDFLRAAPAMLRRNPPLVRLIIIRFLLEGSQLALPFYILFAQRNLHLPVSLVGVYFIVQSLGKVCMGPVWGWISSRYGAGVCLQAVAMATTLIPAMALFAAGGYPGVMPVAFFLIGGVQDGIWIAAYNFLFATVDERDRPMALGIAPLALAFGSIYGPIGGQLAEVSSYPVIFTLALAVTGMGTLLAHQLPKTSQTGQV
jgi:MFS family permease